MIRTLLITLLALIPVRVLAADEADVDKLVRELMGEELAPIHSSKQLLDAYSQVIESLLPAVGDESIEARKDAQQTLQAICWHASRPGAEDERLAVCRAMCRSLGTASATPAREWLLTQLERIGRDESVDAVSALLDDGDPLIQDAALRALQNLPAPGAGARLQAALEAARLPEHRIALINALGYRRESAAAPALRAQADHASDRIRTAALQALALIGDVDAIPLMRAGMHMGSERARAAAVDAYLRLADTLTESGDREAGADIYQRFLRADGRLRCAALIGMGRIGGDEALSLLIPALADEDPEVQGAARAGLALLPADKTLAAMAMQLRTAAPPLKVALLQALADSRDPAIVPVLVKAAADMDDHVQTASRQAIARVLAYVPRTAFVEAVNAECAGAPEPAQVALLPLYRLAADDAALRAVRDAWQTGSPKVKTAALGVLAQWPSPAVADGLLRIAREGDTAEHRVTAMSGYVAILGRRDAGTPSERLAKLQAAMAIARDLDGKKVVLAAIGSVHDRRSLGVARDYLADEALQTDAANALLSIASAVRWTGDVSAAVEALATSTSDADVRTRAEALLTEQVKYEDYIAAWVYCGPFTARGKDNLALFDMTFPPENEQATGVTWRRALLSRDPRTSWAVDLNSMDNGSNRAGYIRTWIWSPSAGRARLEVGSDDGVRAWLNGAVSAEANENRGIGPGQEKADVELQRGFNSLLLKVTQGSGYWVAAARVRGPDGSHMPGLLYMGDPEFASAVLQELDAANGDPHIARIALDTVIAASPGRDDALRMLEAVDRTTRDEGLRKRASELLEELK